MHNLASNNKHSHGVCYGQDEKGLPPTPGTLRLGYSYHLHSSHCFLSTWGVVMLGKGKKKNTKRSLVECFRVM